MNQPKVSENHIFILGSTIILVTIVCLALFHNSLLFRLLLVAVFVGSACRALLITPFQRRKKSQSTKKKTNYQEPKSLSRRQEKDIFFDITRSSGNSTLVLSISKFLEKECYQLTDEMLDAIEWKRFELLCHLIFKASGYNSRLTGNGPDEGVDIRVYDHNVPHKVLFLVQCKWRKINKIDRPLLQQLKGQMATEKVEKGGYCTTSSFTKPARDYAVANGIEVFDRRKIIRSFSELTKPSRQAILLELLSGDYWTPSCASCGEKFQVMTSRAGKNFWGCKNFRKHGRSSISYYEAHPIKNVR